MYSDLVVYFWKVLMDSSSIFRGLNDKGRRDNQRKIVDASKPAVICLQETELENISERDVVSLFRRDFTQFVFLPTHKLVDTGSW